MNDFSKLQDILKYSGLPFFVEPSGTEKSNAAEFLTIMKEERYVIDVVWRPRGGFGVATKTSKVRTPCVGEAR